MKPEITQAAQVVWNYHRLGHALEPADLIFVLGNADLRVAEHAADLFHRGLAPRVAVSGGFGTRKAGPWTKPEAEIFADVLRERGVPENALLLEPRATNTGENVRFTRELLAQRGLDVKTLIALQKPYMERRTYATICKLWPEVSVRVSSPPLDFAAYCSGHISAEEIIHDLTGDLQRIIEYPALGFMIPQAVPEEVRRAYEFLVASGFTNHLIKAKR